MTSGSGTGPGAWSDAWPRDWLARWQSWLDASGFGTNSRPGAGDALGGVAAGYAAFAETIAALARGAMDGEDLGRRLAALLRGEGGAIPGAGGATLRAFLHSVPPEFAGSGGTTAFADLQRENLDTLLRWAAEWLELPVFGPQREWVESIRQVQRAALEEQRAANRVNAHRDAVTARACERFATFLEDESGPPITSVRGLYDLWTDTAESTYAEVVMSEAYGEDFAAWVDAGSATRLRVRALVNRVGALIGVPQREAFEKLLTRQHALRGEVEALRRELATLRTSRTASPDAQSAPRKRAAASRPAQPASKAKRAGKHSAAPPSAARKRKRAPSSPRAEFDIGDILAGRE